MSETTHKGTAVITGASTGIGAVYADRLARRGYDLILVARNRERLGKLADRLSTSSGRSVQVVAADLGRKEDVRRVEDILRTDASITMLVNNAGVGGAAPLLQSDADQMEAMIDLNVTSLTRLTYAVAPRFVERANGTIVNIASIVAVAPELLNGVYGGTKAFVLAFSQSLRHELADKGVRVHAVLPGAIRTEFWDVAGMPVENLPQGMVMSVDHLVDAALAGLDQGEFATVPSLPEAADWNAFEAARVALGPNLSREVPGARYGVSA
ncbi:SDR family oxidoreductase [Paraburkholderia sp. DHOC27]|uniref:SDR family NAD(P)-dependent oxidoreductase n=1 Tax=Paraburkholderia sp. DHOC27 TaxID=2303330 RepID=UPI000E3DE46D|nr:SDR family oxidoreductase [Paraburkholderia sp. DHOC27]RFU48417.1 SDR family oxidoreductase [Paraburkholderia sp. DHOC27]